VLTESRTTGPREKYLQRNRVTLLRNDCAIKSLITLIEYKSPPVHTPLSNNKFQVLGRRCMKSMEIINARRINDFHGALMISMDFMQKNNQQRKLKKPN